MGVLFSRGHHSKGKSSKPVAVMGKSDTIQTYGRMENNRVASANRGLVMASAHFGSNSNSSATKHITIDRENHSATAAAASPMMLDSSSTGGNLLMTQTTTTTTTASGSKRPPLGGVTNSSTTTNVSEKKLHTADKLAPTTDSSSIANALASPRRALRSNSTLSASVVTDEECPQRKNTLESGSITAAADTSSSIVETIPHRLVPARGGRCAVFFAKGKDVFGRSRSGAGGWYPATINKVTQYRNRHSSKLHVRFDDGSLGNYNYPSPNEVQLLSPNPNHNNNQEEGTTTATTITTTPNDHNIMYGEAGQVMYHRPTPTKGVQVGDLVFCFFQQGQGFTSDHWYRGRVAATYRLEDLQVCDIAYDDGDFERNVPYTTGVVLKHADGWDHPEWMVGLPVNIPPKKRTVHVTTGDPIKSGIVKEAKPHGAVWIEYDNGSGTKFAEKRAYLTVAQRLLIHAKDFLMDPKRSFQWPYISDDTAAVMMMPSATAEGNHNANDCKNSLLIANIINESNKSSRQQSKQQRVAKKIQQQQPVIEIVDVEQANNNNKTAAAELPPPKKKLRATRKTPTTTAAAAVTAKESKAQQQQQPTTASKPPTGRKRAPRQASTTTAQRRAPRSKAATTASSSPTMDSPTIGQGVQLETVWNSIVECVAESDWVDSDAEEEGYSSSQQLPAAAACSSTRPIKEIQVSLGSSLASSVNSSDPHLGAETLTFMAVHHKQLPGQRLRQSLVALLTQGPMSGKTQFDDCHRMTLVEQYVSHCLTRPGMADNFALDAGPSYWSDCLTNLTALYYCQNGDEDRTSGFAIDRIAQTVFAKLCSANLFLKLITSQLQAFIGKKGKHQINREQLMTLPIVKDIVGHRRGAKEAFETSAKAYVELCITLGHFDQSHVAGLLLEESDQDDVVVGPSDQSIRFVCMHSRRLLEKAGHITSMLAWLYGYVANEDAQSVGRLLRSIFQRAFNDKQFDPTPFLGDEQSVDKHWSLVKLRLVLNLDKRAIPGVRPMLAETLGVGKQYNAIFG